jgi:hypothetical protein
MNNPDDVIAYKKLAERLQVHIFLNGLDENLNKFEVRFSGRILSWILKKLMCMFVVILFVKLH